MAQPRSSLTRSGVAPRAPTDFSEIDHLSLAALPLADVRQRFGVPPLKVS